MPSSQQNDQTEEILALDKHLVHSFADLHSLAEPANIAAVTNFAQYTAGVKGVNELLDADLKASPEASPPADAPAGTFVQVCDEATQGFYDKIWIALKK